MSYRNGGRDKLREEARCRMCLHPRRRRGVRMLTRHHIVPQRWRGWLREFRAFAFRYRDCDSNIVPLCIRCHHDVEHDPVARYMLRKVLGQNEVAFGIQMWGQSNFDAFYPARLSSERAALAA